MGVTFVITAILSIMILSKSLETMAGIETCPIPRRLGCHKVCKEIDINQFDINGRNCSGRITIWRCSGQCLTMTIPDLEFPHRHSDHTACVYDQGELTEVQIPYCVEGAANEIRSYQYMAPRGCKCAECDSSVMSCESARKRGNPSPPEIEGNSLLMEYLQAPAETRENRW